MVRKWSYLESNTPNLTPTMLDSSIELYHFKVFRKTTRFKKFNRGITKMVRKNYARRKHRSNWLVLSYITKSWVLNYLNMRQFERFYSALSRFNINAYSSDVSVFNLRLQELSNVNGINIVSCSKTPLRRHVNYTKNASFLVNPTKNTNSAIVQTLQPLNLTTSTEVFPNVITLENHSYSYDDLTMIAGSPTYHEQAASIGGCLFQPASSINSSLYSVLVSLTLLNTNR